MSEFGLNIKTDTGGKRVELECEHQNGLLYVVPAESSWVCSEELMHAHAMAGFFRQLMELDDVARHVVHSVFWNMGQNCTSNSRLIVHASLHDELVGRVVDRLKDWRTGNPLDPANALGAIVTREHFDKVMGYIDGAKADGASLSAGGEALADGDGLYIAPTVFGGVDRDMTIARDEVFGPVLAVIPTGSDTEAIDIANDTPYGLQASLFTANVKTAHRVSRAIQAGTVSVNCYGEGDIATPFGGFKQSGFGGRDNSLMAHDQYTQTKTIWIDISDDGIDEEIG